MYYNCTETQYIIVYIFRVAGKGVMGKIRTLLFYNTLKNRTKGKSGQAAKKYIAWKYEKEMSFIQPHFDTRQYVITITINLICVTL